MSFFTRRSLNKLQQAVISGDLALLKKQFNKLDQTLLTEHPFSYENRICNLPELAIYSGQPKSLEHLLQAGCSLETVHPEPLLYQALQHPQQSLKLITVLLQAAIPLDYPNSDPQHALFACFRFCPTSSLMLHLSRLNEYGADLNQADAEGQTALLLALQSEHKPLVQMLINSGAEMPETIPQGWCSEEITGYARRLADDLKIRQMMLV
ncbi:ankyrin repeat domain-containing protein [uncultured Amphritea sp.]|uniref:ankyrin repeat domain-containing protein n=1 Tax=uncultured Amphritea sp. TaxID=981605 RepID=UPI0026100022|nr:ankyrin repeat domain-containing protein [uncultured Amphritea sp.]